MTVNEEKAIFETVVDLFKATFPDVYPEFIYRGDRKCVEWICKHGVGHPIWDSQDCYIHGCDGCCKQYSLKKFRKQFENVQQL